MLHSTAVMASRRRAISVSAPPARTRRNSGGAGPYQLQKNVTDRPAWPRWA